MRSRSEHVLESGDDIIIACCFISYASKNKMIINAAANAVLWLVVSGMGKMVDFFRKIVEYIVDYFGRNCR